MNLIKIGNLTQNTPSEPAKRFGVVAGALEPKGTEQRVTRVSLIQKPSVGENVSGDVFQGKSELHKAVAEINETARVFNIRLRFQVDRETGDTCVLVIDLEKGEVIRKIPPAKALDLAYSLYDMVGLLFDKIV